MQPHGGTSRKGTLLYSNFDISSLWLPLDTSVSSEVETVHRRVDSTGTERVTGAAALKGTQAYPAQFGNRVADIFVQALRASSRQDGVPVCDLHLIPASDDDWADAGLDEVINDLMRAMG